MVLGVERNGFRELSDSRLVIFALEECISFVLQLKRLLRRRHVGQLISKSKRETSKQSSKAGKANQKPTRNTETDTPSARGTGEGKKHKEQVGKDLQTTHNTHCTYLYHNPYLSVRPILQPIPPSYAHNKSITRATPASCSHTKAHQSSTCRTQAPTLFLTKHPPNPIHGHLLEKHKTQPKVAHHAPLSIRHCRASFHFGHKAPKPR